MNAPGRTDSTANGANGGESPEALDLVTFARQYQDARKLHRRILPIGVSDAKARCMGFVVSRGVRGRLSWSDWLRSNRET